MIDHGINEELAHSARSWGILIDDLHRFSRSDAGGPEIIPNLVELADDDVLDVVVHELVSQRVD